MKNKIFNKVKKYKTQITATALSALIALGILSVNSKDNNYDYILDYNDTHTEDFTPNLPEIPEKNVGGGLLIANLVTKLILIILITKI